ncbi:MAG: hypothetical protein JWR21_2836 [Herminiimonas sp.]|nr:hypothetical protein [Herminiimonas sp.]
MAKSKHLFDQFATVTDSSRGTLKLIADNLRKAGQLPASKPGFGAVDYDGPATVNLMLAVLLAPTASRAAETVQRLRTQPLTSVHFNMLDPTPPPAGRVRAAFEAVAPLGIKWLDNYTVGSMLDQVLDAMRSGDFDKWSAGSGDTIVDFFGGGRSTMIAFDRFDAKSEMVGFSFEVDKLATPPPVERTVRVNCAMLKRLAETLGPQPDAVILPPPY